MHKPILYLPLDRIFYGISYIICEIATRQRRVVKLPCDFFPSCEEIDCHVKNANDFSRVASPIFQQTFDASVAVLSDSESESETVALSVVSGLSLPPETRSVNQKREGLAKFAKLSLLRKLSFQFARLLLHFS